MLDVCFEVLDSLLLILNFNLVYDSLGIEIHDAEEDFEIVSVEFTICGDL
jgi:hypothetical protein